MVCRRSSVRLFAVCSLLVVQVALSPPANAFPGDLDPSFGTGGVVITDLGGYDEILALTIQEDGMIVAAGDTFDGATGGSDIMVARYRSDGTLDASFGSGGVVTTDLAGRIDIGTGVALQPNGKIVVTARSQEGSADAANDFALVRYTSAGDLDQTFGVGGSVLTDFGGLFDAPWGGVAIQPDGKIVAGGTVNSNATGTVSDFGLARYNSDGSLDDAFGEGGKVVTNIEDHSAVAESMVLQPDGRIVLGGGDIEGLTLTRYQSDGSLDPTFGVGGVAAHVVHGTGAEGLAMQADGKLVTVGRANVTFTPPDVYASDIALERLNADGTPDLTFGSGGAVTADIGDVEWAPDVAIQDDGKIVVAGNSFANNTWRVVLARYNLDGALDPEFGTGGISLSSPFVDLVAVAIQPDGKILAGGLTSSNEADLGLARYLGSGESDGLKLDVYWGPRHSRKLAYANSGTLTAGDYEIDPSTGRPAGISGTGTIPSAVSGDATVSFDIAFSDATKKWSGTVIVNDPGAGFSATVPIHSWRFGVTRDGTTTRGVLWGFKAQSVPQKCFMFVFAIDDAA